MQKPYISIIIPVYNEQDNLENLYQRLTSVMDTFDKTYEIILTNDGSRDNSAKILNTLHQRRPEIIRIIHFNGNFGQHMAIMAGFERARGDIIITLDADLQNPPEEIPKLIAAVEQGHDYVGGVRKNRQDTRFRRYASKLNNYIRFKITKIRMTDQGSMLRAFSKSLIDLMVAANESSLFIPALGYSLAANPTEIEVEHSPRAAGESKYNLYRLLRLNFDLMTGYSVVPLQAFTILGMLCSLLSTLLVAYMILRRLFIGPEAQGLFTLFAILFFLISILIMGLGIVGEYIGRIYQEIRKRPRYLIKEILEKI